MEWVNSLYGKEYVSLRVAIWEKGFKNGHGAEEHGLSPEAVEWLDQAIGAYYEHRIGSILSHASRDLSNSEVKKQWEELLVNMYGDDKAMQQNFLNKIMQDPRMNADLKNWLQS